MRARRQLTSDPSGTHEVWPAFTDVMSTLALILFVLVLLAYVRNLISSKSLDALEGRITASQVQLRAASDDLHRTKAEAATDKIALQASASRLRAQEDVLADNARELGTVRAQLQSVAVLRVAVLEKLKRAVEAELGTQEPGAGALVSIGDTGNIVLNESLVFEKGSYAIKEQGRRLLAGLARALGDLLADAAVRENIDAILIQGHADISGSDAFNWELSAKRATAVLEALFEANRELPASYGHYFAAAAYSKFRPLETGTTPAILQKNRRIEIAIIPKDTHLKEIIDDYLGGPDGGVGDTRRAAP